MRYILFAWFLLLSVSAFPQSGNLLVLKEKLNKTTDPNQRVLLLCELSQHYNSSSLNLSLTLAQKALRIADSTNFKVGLGQAHNAVGLAYDRLGDYDKAAHAYYKSVRIREALKDSAGLAKSYNNIGSIYNIKDNLDQATYFYQKSLDIAILINDTVSVAKAYNNLGSIYQKKGQLEIALSYMLQALEIKKQLGDIERITVGLNNIGFLYTDLKRYNKAIAYHHEALKLIDADSYTFGKVYSLYGLAQAYLYKKSPDKALPYALENMKVVKQLNSKDEIALAAKLLNEIYADLKDFQKAHFYLQLYNKYEDSVHTLEVDAKIAELHLAYEKEKTERDNLLLKAETELQKQKINRNNTIQYFTFAILLTVCILAFTLYKGRKRLHNVNQLLLQKNIAISEHTQQLERRKEKLLQQASMLEEQKEELNRLNNVKDRLFSIIAHDLKGPLVSLKGLLQVLAKGNLPQEKVATMMGLLETSQQNSLWLLDNLLLWSKAQMNGLRVEPVNIRILELIETNTKLIGPQAVQKGITVTSYIAPETYLLADKEMTNLIIRNILSNAIKFCRKGDKIELFASTSAECVTLSISDTGIGIPQDKLDTLFDGGHAKTSHTGTANEKGSGLGLQLCKAFIDLNGGRIWAESQVGEGTTFSISLPVGLPQLTLVDNHSVTEQALA